MLNWVSTMSVQKIRAKEEVLNVVIDPNVKQQLRSIAAIEGRSMAAQVNMFLTKAVEEFKTKNSVEFECDAKPTRIVNRRSFSSRWINNIA